MGGCIGAAKRRPSRVPHLLVPRKIRYAALRGSVHALVARGKRSAPAKHSDRSTDDGTEV